MYSHVSNDGKNIKKQTKNVDVNGVASAVVATGAPLKSGKSIFNTRFVYNSKVKPAFVEANLARKVSNNSQNHVKSRVFWASGSNGGEAMASDNVIDNASETASEVSAHMSDNVSGQELIEAKCVSSAGDVDRCSTHHFAQVDCISESGIPQSVKILCLLHFMT